MKSSKQIKTALITGASKGLGKSLAMAFAKCGYNLIISGRDRSDIEIVKSDIQESYSVSVASVVGELVDFDVIDQLAREAKTRSIDVLVNNAGMYINKLVTQTQYEEFKRIMQVNFLSQVKLTQAILPIFLDKGAGTIVNINSLAGKEGAPGEAAYCASKHALRGFSEALRYEVTKLGIRIINVYLGAMATRMSAERKDYEKFILPDDAAQIIVSNCENNFASANQNEIVIGRRTY